MRIFNVALYLLTLSFAEKVYLLRCKCNTEKGLSQCYGDYCDIHNQDGKRAACGALRRAKQTVFACVLIKQTSNDTYCHVVRSTTACWCRSMDFCNADLESELFDVDDYSEQLSSSEKVDERILKDVTRQDYSKTVKTTVRLSPTPLLIQTTTKRSAKTKINSAVEFAVVQKMKLTAEPKKPLLTVYGEILDDSYEDELDENDYGFQWQAISIPESVETQEKTTETAQTVTSKSTSSQRQTQTTKNINVVINQITEKTETSSPTTRAKSTTFQIPRLKQDEMQYARTESRWNPLVVSQRPHIPIHAIISTDITSSAQSTVFSTPSEKSASTSDAPKTVVIQKPPRIIVDRPSSIRGRKITIQRYSPSPTVVYSQSAPKTILDQWEIQSEKNPDGSPSHIFTSHIISLIVPSIVLYMFLYGYF